MQSVSVAVAKDKLPYLLHLVENGEQIEITRHGKPIAVITQNGNLKYKPSEFEIAYRNFRERLGKDDLLTDEEWNEYFNPPREIQIGLRHEEDFE